MQHISPLGNVYQAGTLSGNPIAMIAGYTMLKTLKDNPGIYKELDDKTETLHKGLDGILSKGDVPYVINRMGSMISVHFSDKPVNDFSAAASADNARFNRFFHAMLDQGIYLPPSAFETWFISTALSAADIEQTIEAARKALQA